MPNWPAGPSIHGYAPHPYSRRALSSPRGQGGTPPWRHAGVANVGTGLGKAALRLHPEAGAHHLLHVRKGEAGTEREVGLLGRAAIGTLVRRVPLDRIDVAIEQRVGEGRAEDLVEDPAVAKALVLDVRHRREAEVEVLAAFGAERLYGDMQERIADVAVGFWKGPLERGRVADHLVVCVDRIVVRAANELAVAVEGEELAHVGLVLAHDGPVEKGDLAFLERAHPAPAVGNLADGVDADFGGRAFLDHGAGARDAVEIMAQALALVAGKVDADVGSHLVDQETHGGEDLRGRARHLAKAHLRLHGEELADEPRPVSDR